MMRNVWFIPTAGTLCNWLERAGFQNVRCVDTSPTLFSEQRKTKHAPFDSLEDFLDPKDRTKTVEGYPAPNRCIVLGDKK